MIRNDVQQDERLLKQLLKPSYLSASLCSLLTLLVLGMTAYSQLTSGQGWLADTIRTVSASNHHLFQLHQENGADAFSTTLLFVFWSCIGLVVYYVVVGIGRGLIELNQIKQEMGYMNASRRVFVQHILHRLGIRLIGIVGLLVALNLLLKFAIPFGVAAVQVSTHNAAFLLAVLESAVILLLTSHLVVVMARLIVLRPRLFSATI